jgi:hypothetical protein
MFGALFSVVALIAFAVTPALAQATPTLVHTEGVYEENEPLEVGETFYMWNGWGGATFTWTGGVFGCDENELEMEVTENPGASAEIVSSRFAGSGPKGLCVLNPSAAYYYAIPAMDGSFDFSSGGQASFDGTMELVIFHGSKEPQLERTCAYELEGDGELDSSGLSLEPFEATLVTGNGCWSKLPTSINLYVTDALGGSVQSVE